MTWGWGVLAGVVLESVWSLLLAHLRRSVQVICHVKGRISRSPTKYFDLPALLLFFVAQQKEKLQQVDRQADEDEWYQYHTTWFILVFLLPLNQCLDYIVVAHSIRLVWRANPARNNRHSNSVALQLAMTSSTTSSTSEAVRAQDSVAWLFWSTPGPIMT